MLRMAGGGGDDSVLVHCSTCIEVGPQMAVFRPWRVSVVRSSLVLGESLLAGCMDRSSLKLLEGVMMTGYCSARSDGYIS